MHGAEVTYRKFIGAVKMYEATIAILAGDITGKVIVPIVKEPDGTYTATHMGQKNIARTEEELDALKSRIRFAGYYPFDVTPDEMEKYQTGKTDPKEKWKELTCAVLRDWLGLAEKHLMDKGVKFYLMPGNDDEYYIDEIIKTSSYVINPSDQIVNIDDAYDMINLPYANITPWKCPRDVTEEQLYDKIKIISSKVNNMNNCIFNIHVPPYGTSLDQAPLIKDGLQLQAGEMVSVGSTAVLKAIKEFHPLLGLHGHIHESRAIERIGRTVCVNPGSEYGEGIIHGALVDLENGKIKNAVLTTG
jgi:hypothetical protein